MIKNKRNSVKEIPGFKIIQENGLYIAEGVDLAIVAHAPTFEELEVRIEEAMELHLEEK